MLSLRNQCKTEETYLCLSQRPRSDWMVEWHTLCSQRMCVSNPFLLLLTSYVALAVISPLWASASNCKMGLITQSQGSKNNKGQCLVPTRCSFFMSSSLCSQGSFPFPNPAIATDKNPTSFMAQPKDEDLCLTAHKPDTLLPTSILWHNKGERKKDNSKWDFFFFLFRHGIFLPFHITYLIKIFILVVTTKK